MNHPHRGGDARVRRRPPERAGDRVLRALTAALLALAVAAPAGARAAEPAPPADAAGGDENIRIDTTVVEASRPGDDRNMTEAEARAAIDRVPGGVDLVSRAEIRGTRAANLEDALQRTPGVLVFSRFGSDEVQISIRGSGLRNNFHLRGINLLLDAFPYGSADGSGDFESIELLSLERIEVFKGANALRYGGNALGGAMNFVTLTGRTSPGLTLRSEGGSFGYAKNFASAGSVHGPLDLYAAYSNTLLDGYRAHSQQQRNRVYSSAGIDLGNGLEARVDFNAVDSDERLPGALTREQFEENPRQANPEWVAQDAARNYDWQRLAFTLRKAIDAERGVEWLVQGNGQDLAHPLPFAIIDQRTANWGTEARYLSAASLLGRENRFTAGLQYFGTWQDDRQYANQGGVRGEETKRNTNGAGLVAAYANEEHRVAEAWTLVLGGRLQWSFRDVAKHLATAGGPAGSVDDVYVAPKVGAIWQATPAIQGFVNVSRSVEPPLLFEITAPGNAQPKVSDLQPQDAWQFEIGTRGTVAEWLGFELSVYDIELRDEIVNVNIEPFPGAPFTVPAYRNVPRSRHTGVEAGFDATLARDLGRRAGAGFTDRLHLVQSYTFGSFRYLDDPTWGDNVIPGLPPSFLGGALLWEGSPGFRIGPAYRAAPSSWYVNSANTAKAPAYALFDFEMGWRIAPWNLEVFFEARNLLDVNYVSAVQVDSANGAYYEPGDGRAFYAGIQWRWT